MDSKQRCFDTEGPSPSSGLDAGAVGRVLVRVVRVLVRVGEIVSRCRFCSGPGGPGGPGIFRKPLLQRAGDALLLLLFFFIPIR
jgi:hypothetical protein